MNRLPYILCVWGTCCLCLLFGGACSNDEDETEAYPALITEFVDIQTDDAGNGCLLITDKGTVYAINQPLKDLRPNVVYRIIGGYVLTGRTNGPYQIVELRTAENITLLNPVEDPSGDDAPVQVTSIWKSGAYLNFNLSPKTQGGQHEWGYRVDGIRETETGQTYDLSLYHRQPGDPYSYSTTVYASLIIGKIGELQQGDSIAFSVLTFDGHRTWRFAY